MPLKWLQEALLCTLSLSGRWLCNEDYEIVCHSQIVQVCWLFFPGLLKSYTSRVVQAVMFDSQIRNLNHKVLF